MKDSHSQLRIGLVGCGQIGRLHADRLAGDDRVEVVALCDSDTAAAESLGAKHAEGARTFTELNDFLDSGLIDGVVICSPTHLHFDQALACLDRGLPVLCEKPLADSRARIVTLIEATHRDAAPLLSVAYQRRWAAAYRTLRREIRSRRWGEVRGVTVRIMENWQQTIGGTWRDDPQRNVGGFIGDAGSHKVDAVFYVTGLTPVDVFARCRNCGSRVEITATVSATLEGDVPLSLNFVGNAQNFSDELHVHLDRADFLLRNGQLWIGETGTVRPVDDLEPDRDPDAAFADILLNERENLAPAECALPVFDFTQAILESSRSQQLVRI